jgi:hypothetical protein
MSQCLPLSLRMLFSVWILWIGTPVSICILLLKMTAMPKGACHLVLKIKLCFMWDSGNGDHEVDWLLGCDAIQSLLGWRISHANEQSTAHAGCFAYSSSLKMEAVHVSTRLHGITSWKIVLFKITLVRWSQAETLHYLNLSFRDIRLSDSIHRPCY